MPTVHTLNPAVLATKLASLAATLAVIAGVIVLAGWAFDIAALKSVLPGWVAMKANTAVCFILIGIALWLTARQAAISSPQRSTFFSRIARLGGLLAGLIGLLTLGEYIFGWNIGIDQWLFHEPNDAVGTSDPGRMAPETALCFVLLAAALWLTGDSHQTRRIIRARWTVLMSVLLGLLVAALALAAGLSYPTPGLGAYGWFGLTIMAMHTAVLFVMLGMAVIAISWRQDVLKWSLGRNTTAAFACGMAVLVLVGFNINRNQYWMGEIDRKIAYSVEAQDYIESIVIEVIDAQAHTRGYIITGDELFKARYLEAKANSNVKLDALRKLITGNPRQQQFARIEAQALEQLQWFQQVIDARQTSMADATRNTMIRHGEGLLDNFRITYGQVKNEHQQFIKELRQEAKSVSRFSYITIAVGTLASLLIFLTVMFRLNFAVNERRRAEELQQNMAAKYHTMFDLSSDAIMLLDGKSFFDCNPAALRMFGCTTRDDFISKHPAEFSPPTQPHGKDSMSLANQHIATAFMNGSHLFEWVHRRLDGAEFPAEVLLTAMELDGKPVLQATVRDITGRKQAEDSLRKLSLAVEQSPNSIDITDLDANIEYVNETFVKTSGYSVAELIGQNPRLMQSGKTPRATYDDMWAHLTRGEAWKGEFINRRKDGSEYIESVLVSPVRQADGRVTHYLAIKEDITEFKQAQKALRDSRENLHRLLNSIAEGAYGVNTKGNCTFVNRAFLQMLGYQNDSEVLGKHIHELIHHSHADGSPYPAEECRAYLAYRTNQSINVSDEVFWRKDGIAIPVEYWSHPIETDGGTIGAIVTFVDITERKRAEDKLRESEEKFSKVFESNPAMVAIGTIDGKMVDVNLSYANFLGFSRKEMLGKSLADLGVIRAEELQRLLELGQRSGASLRNVEVSLQTRGGSILNALLSADLVLLGGVPYRLATLQDITARKQAETQIAEQLDELRRWYDATSGREGRILNLKHEVNELLGQAGQQPRYPSAELVDEGHPDV